MDADQKDGENRIKVQNRKVKSRITQSYIPTYTLRNTHFRDIFNKTLIVNIIFYAIYILMTRINCQNEIIFDSRPLYYFANCG